MSINHTEPWTAPVCDPAVLRFSCPAQCSCVSLPTWHCAVGVPQVHYFGREGLHNVLVIDLLGPSLEDLFSRCGRRFSIATVCMVAKQVVSIFSLVPELPRYLGLGCRSGSGANHQAISSPKVTGADPFFPSYRLLACNRSTKDLWFIVT